LAVVKQALRATHGEEEFEKLSGYYTVAEPVVPSVWYDGWRSP
jgi:hypothetical protein